MRMGMVVGMGVIMGEGLGLVLVMEDSRANHQRMTRSGVGWCVHDVA